VLVGEVPHLLEIFQTLSDFLGSTGRRTRTAQKSGDYRILAKEMNLMQADEELNVPFFVGESVKVIDGRSNSFTGIIEEVMKKRKSLR